MTKTYASVRAPSLLIGTLYGIRIWGKQVTSDVVTFNGFFAGDTPLEKPKMLNRMADGDKFVFTTAAGEKIEGVAKDQMLINAATNTRITFFQAGGTLPEPVVKERKPRAKKAAAAPETPADSTDAVAPTAAADEHESPEVAPETPVDQHEGVEVEVTADEHEVYVMAAEPAAEHANA